MYQVNKFKMWVSVATAVTCIATCCISIIFCYEKQKQQFVPIHEYRHSTSTVILTLKQLSISDICKDMDNWSISQCFKLVQNIYFSTTET